VRLSDALLAEMILRGDTATPEGEETDDNPGGNQDPCLASHADDNDLAFLLTKSQGQMQTTPWHSRNTPWQVVFVNNVKTM
jgi:hypothetical protein